MICGIFSNRLTLSVFCLFVPECTSLCSVSLKKGWNIPICSDAENPIILHTFTDYRRDIDKFLHWVWTFVSVTGVILISQIFFYRSYRLQFQTVSSVIPSQHLLLILGFTQVCQKCIIALFRSSFIFILVSTRFLTRK